MFEDDERPGFSEVERQHRVRFGFHLRAGAARKGQARTLWRAREDAVVGGTHDQVDCRRRDARNASSRLSPASRIRTEYFDSADLTPVEGQAETWATCRPKPAMRTLPGV